MYAFAALAEPMKPASMAGFTRGSTQLFRLYETASSLCERPLCVSACKTGRLRFYSTDFSTD
jgi:hypothetical protein